MNKKRFLINLIASVFAFIVQMGISFALTPFLVEKLGDEAYGFIGLANNFVSYAAIITIALNSMAGRFITVEIHKGNTEKANQYYSSTFFANIIMSVVIGIISTLIILNLNKFINIPEALNMDVKITFALAFVNLIISLMSTIFTVSTFIKNRLELTSIRQIISNVIKLLLLIVLFVFLKPKIYYIFVATIACTIYLLISNISLTKKIASELKFKFDNFSAKAVKTLLSSGIWNSINSLSRVLLTGLDLLIANLFVGAEAMGILSIAKTIPTAVEGLLSTLGNVFAPSFTMLYSQNKEEELINSVKFSIKVLSLIMIVPLAGFIAFGTSFFSLWLPYKTHDEIIQIQILSILTLAPHLLSACIFSLHYLDTVTNQLKRPVVFTLIMSVVSTVAVIIILKTTNLGIYAVAGVSSIAWCLKVLFFTPINAAYNLKVKLTTFYSVFLRTLVCLGILLITYIFINSFINIQSWKMLILIAGIVGIIGYIFMFITILNKEEKKKIRLIVDSKLKKEI